MTASRNLFQYIPKPKQLCLCGSGQVYSDCCSERLPGFDPANRAYDASIGGDYEAALLAARAKLCQYAIWHKSHTAPVMDNPKVEYLLKTDIEALSDYVGDICGLHFRLERPQELPAVLERLRDLVADVRWHRKITYHQALIMDATGEEAKAKREFSKLGAIDPEAENDVEILQAYLDLFGDDLSFAEKNTVCDRILKITRSVSDRVQYHGVKAMAYAGVGDWGEARKQLSLAVAHAHMKEKEKPLGTRTRLLLGSALSFLGLLTREDRRFVEAEGIFKALLADQEHWSTEGTAMLWDNLGECYRYWGKWSDGDNAYREAIRLERTGIRSVFFAECEMHEGRKGAAATILDGIDFSTLSSAEQVDFAYGLAELAVESSDRGRLKQALDALEKVKPNEMFFEQRRLSFIVDVQAALANGPGSNMWQILREAFSEPIRRLNRYVMLQPNWYGLGVNVNAIIEDAFGPKDKDEQ